MKKISNSALNTSGAKRRQQSLLLASRPDFQKDIMGLRKKWHIPLKGFTDEENSAVEKWWRWLGERDDKWYREKWPVYRKELIKFERDATATKVSYKDYLDRKEEINLEMPINAFYEDIRKVRIKYKLGPSWKDGLTNYIFSNDAERIRLYAGIRMHIPFEKGTDKEEISIVIDEDTTLEDIKAAWPNIKFHQSKLSYRKRQKQQPINKEILERGAKAYKMHIIQKKTLKEVADELSDEYGVIYNYSDIATMIRNYKKVTGMN